MKTQSFQERNFLFQTAVLDSEEKCSTQGSFVKTSTSVLISLNPEGSRDRQGSMSFSLHILQPDSGLNFPQLDKVKGSGSSYVANQRESQSFI